MGELVKDLDEWLKQTLESPLGQLAVLLLIPVVKLVYGYLQDRRKRKVSPPGPSSAKA